MEDTSKIMETLRRASSKLKTLRDRQNNLKGKKEAILSSLKSEFSVSTQEEAEALLAEQEKKLQEQEERAVELAQEMQGVIDKCEGKNL